MSKFEVIAGGAGEGTERAEVDLTGKQRHVNRIRAEAIRWRAGAKTPRRSLAFGVSLLAFMSAFAVIEAAARFLPLRVSALVTVVVCFCVLVATFAVVMRKSKAPLTQADLVDQLLNDYNPVSPLTFRKLQEEVLAAGDLHFDLVIRWAEFETEAIRVASGAPNPPSRAFLSKRV